MILDRLHVSSDCLPSLILRYCSVIKDERKPYNHVYDFIFDRLRCVRQEIVICNLPAADTVSLLEPMIIFLAYSYYQLSEEQIANFDPKICGQHLQECLKKTLTCYDEMTGRKTKYPSSRRPLIESIYLVFNLGSEEAMQRGLYIQSDLELKFEDCVRSSWTISRCCWQGNYYRALKSMWQLPCILQGLIYAKHVQGWRQRLLNSLSSAYSSPNVSIPFDFLIRITCLDETHLKTFCSHVNIEINSPNSVVKFNKKSHLYETPPPRPRKEIQISHSSI